MVASGVGAGGLPGPGAGTGGRSRGVSASAICRAGYFTSHVVSSARRSSVTFRRGTSGQSDRNRSTVSDGSTWGDCQPASGSTWKWSFIQSGNWALTSGPGIGPASSATSPA